MERKFEIEGSTEGFLTPPAFFDDPLRSTPLSRVKLASPMLFEVFATKALAGRGSLR
jgi:hypothetical protein